MKTQIFKSKHAVLLLLVAVLSFSKVLPAVALNPTIINGDLMLCPLEGETLMTQEYDTYQWYKDGYAIPGATGQTHYIFYYEDVGSSFSVFVTQGAQSAMSPPVFVDGHVFLPLVVMDYGEGYWLTTNGDDAFFHMCSYHELVFEIMMPFNTNLQWYKNGVPIEGANNAVYSVSETGVYWATGSPELCPNLVEYSYIFDVTVYDPPQPIITQSANTLITSVFPGQWFAGADPIPGATGQYFLPEASGFYSFLYTDQQGCEAHSEEYYFDADALYPTIINGDIILCPQEGETLMTQEYDTYQWYKDGNAIPGATSQTHYVDYYEDGGSAFSVFVTQGTESAMSPSILVDGYAFLPLVVMDYGEGYWLTINGDDAFFHMCSYHELIFEIMMPFNTNLQWYKNGVPIEGATNAVYEVNETGIYWATGSPELCPNLIEYSYIFDVTVYDPPQPIITQSANTLITSVFPGQWFAGADPITGATGQYLIPEATGFYSFLYTDDQGCESHSEEYYFDMEILGSGRIRPVKDPEIKISGNMMFLTGATGWNYQILSTTGQVIMNGTVNNDQLSISQLNNGFYILRLENNERVVLKKFVRN